MIVAVTAVGALSYTRFADSPEPLALILREVGQPGTATFLAASAVIALPTVILAFLYGQSRIFFVMARDRMLPQSLAKVSSRGTPVRITLFTAGVVAFFAGFFPIDQIAALANAGTLTAFVAVAVCMLVLRVRAPDAVRPFRTPLAWVVGIGGALGCLYLFISLPHQTQILFGVWNLVGLAIFFAYARRNADKEHA
jgi:APA family basic amino acid/polyamine antiporter